VRAATRQSIFTIGYGIALFFFAYFLNAYGGRVVIPLFGRAASEALLVLTVCVSFALIAIGSARLVPPRR
jgi:hypothetical protein